MSQSSKGGYDIGVLLCSNQMNHRNMKSVKIHYLQKKESKTMNYKLSLSLVLSITLVSGSLFSAHPRDLKREKIKRWVENAQTLGQYVSPVLLNAYNVITKSPKALNRPFSSNRADLEKRLEKRYESIRGSALKNEKKSKSGKSKLDCILKKLCCQSPICITQRDVGPQGLTIVKPGYYCLKENIIFTPISDGIPAITIDSDNVVLDLNGKVLAESTVSFNNFDNTSGIIINSGRNYVQVKNGVVTAFSNHGILAESAYQVPSDHFGISMKDLSVTNCGKITTDPVRIPFNQRAGIGIDGATDVSLENCVASGITAFTQPEALDSYYVENISFEQCEGLGSISGDSPVGSEPAGISLIFADTFLFNNCVGNESTAIGVINLTAPYGILIYSSNNGTLNNCISQGSNGADAVGIGIGSSSNFTLNNCISQGCNGILADGIDIFSCSSLLMNNCQGSFNTGTNQTIGIYLEGCTDAILENSIGSNNSTVQPATCPGCIYATVAVGIALEFCTDTIVRNCNGSDNQLEVPSYFPQSFVGGIVAVVGSSSIWVDNCLACNNTTTASSADVDTVAGFFVAQVPGYPGATTDIIFSNCVANGQQASSTLSTATPVAGFALNTHSDGSPVTTTTVSRIIVTGCTASNNTNTVTSSLGFGLCMGSNGYTASADTSIVQNSNFVGNGVGIQVNGALTQYNIFADNKIQGNTVAGVIDTTGLSNAYTGNFAYNHLVPNYTGLPAGTPVRTWVIGSAPLPSPAGNLDNFDVQ